MSPHRRRGVVRSLIEQQIRGSADAGEAAVLLYASEGGIYGRFGFGNATVFRRMVVGRGRARLERPVDASGVRRMTTDQARPLLPDIYDRWRRSAPGALSRDAKRWELMLSDRESARHGASALQHLVHPDGYVSYRVKSAWDHGDPNGECEILDYVPGRPRHTRLSGRRCWAWTSSPGSASYRVPFDDPLPLLLTDPRAVDTGIGPMARGSGRRTSRPCSGAGPTAWRSIVRSPSSIRCWVTPATGCAAARRARRANRHRRRPT